MEEEGNQGKVRGGIKQRSGLDEEGNQGLGRGGDIAEEWVGGGGKPR